MTETNATRHVLADETLGGIKREYVEVDRKAEVGEKLVIVNADVQCEDPYNNGDIFEVESLLGCSRGIQTPCYRDIFDFEYRVLEPTDIVHIDGQRYEMVCRVAKVGDRIIVTKSHDFPKGFVSTVKGYDELIKLEDTGYDAEQFLDPANESYRVLVPVEATEDEPKPADPIDVIANLAQEIAELKRTVSRITDNLGWHEMGPGRIANLRNDVSDIKRDIASLEEQVDQDCAENEETYDHLYEEMKRMKDEIDTLHKDNRTLGEELARLKEPTKAAECAPIDAPLVFIQRKIGDAFDVYQDGKKLRGVRHIRIDAAAGEFTTHDIEFVSGATEEERP
ncbi:hypothetical protein [Bacillus sp. FSL R5-0447]|uniref:hypothetical protein n=1 Tax=Bacillus sp. FSL R5-0447 TaxID=2975303 RepID=UPI003159DDFF